MAAERAGQLGWRFWFAWVIGSMLGWGVAFLATFVAIAAVLQAVFGVADPADSGVPFGLVLTLGFGLAGAGMGLAQGVLLRGRVGRTGLWVLGSSLGFVVVAALFSLLSGIVTEQVNEVVHNAAGGLVAGALQWRVLRGWLAGAGWWVPVSTAGFLLAGAVSRVVSVVVGGEEAPGAFVGMAAMAALTATALILLSRRAPTKAAPAAGLGS